MSITGTMAGATAGTVPTGGCLSQVDSNGSRIWLGQASPLEDRVANELMDIANSYPAQISGVAFCSDFHGVEIFLLKQASGAPFLKIKSVIDAKHGIPIFVRRVNYSLTDLLFEQERLLPAGGSKAGIVGVSPDILNDGLIVDLENAGSVALRTSSSQFPILTAMPVRTRMAARSGFTSAQSDNSPWKMGGVLFSPLGGSNYGVCSSGVPLRVNGVASLLTAGHCTGNGNFYNSVNLNYVGTSYFTPFPAAASTGGDWRLLKRIKLQPRRFQRRPRAATPSYPSSEETGSRPLGSGLCTSGSTSGQDLPFPGNQQLHPTDDRGYSCLDDWWRCVTTVIGMAAPTPTELRGGDSGGPCYYNNGSGGMIVDGTVTGYYNLWWSSGMSYYCTQLSAVRSIIRQLTWGEDRFPSQEEESPPAKFLGG